MPDILLFWKAPPDLAMPADAIARELNWGEEVPGLVDLPVRSIIDRLKAEFPDHDERPGSLHLTGSSGDSWEATWGWQYFKLQRRGEAPTFAPADARQQCIDILAEFGCGVFEM